MKSLLAGRFGCLLVFTAACDALGNSTTKSVDPNALPGAAGAAANGAEVPSVDLGKLLGGITDGPTAAAAKGPLEAALGQLKNALAGADAKAKVESAASGADPVSSGKQMAMDVLAKFGLGAGTVDTITGLLDNPAVKSAIGPMLEQLKGMIPAM